VKPETCDCGGWIIRVDDSVAEYRCQRCYVWYTKRGLRRVLLIRRFGLTIGSRIP
jgi:hypothetical protein